MNKILETILMLSISLGYISIKYENFSALGVRLDDGDFKTIVENPKYLALKHETVQKSDHLVYLNPCGVAYLRDVWGKNVNKCGEKRNSKETVKESENHTSASFLAAPKGDVQRFDNRIMNLTAGFFSAPEK